MSIVFGEQAGNDTMIFRQRKVGGLSLGFSGRRGMKTLVAYYSRTGNTRRVARRIAEGMEGDIEEIHDTKDREGIIGFLTGGKDALFRNDTTLGTLSKVPSDYDFIVVGTPVWAGTVCPAVRTWLSQFGQQLKDVAFFLTSRTSRNEATFTEMAEVSGATPHETLVITAAEIKKETWIAPTEEFVKELIRRQESGAGQTGNTTE